MVGLFRIDFQMVDEGLSGVEVERFGGECGPVEDGGFEGEVRDEGGEVGG